MNKFTNDNAILKAQNKVYEAAEFEKSVCDQFLSGQCSEDYYVSAMEATEQAVSYAVSLGCSYKDLPPV